MAQTSAERQRAYRERHLKAIDATGARLSMVVRYDAKLTLERLASCYSVTQAGILEHLLSEAEKSLLAKLSGEEQDAYFDKALRGNALTGSVRHIL